MGPETEDAHVRMPSDRARSNDPWRKAKPWHTILTRGSRLWLTYAPRPQHSFHWPEKPFSATNHAVPHGPTLLLLHPRQTGRRTHGLMVNPARRTFLSSANLPVDETSSALPLEPSQLTTPQSLCRKSPASLVTERRNTGNTGWNISSNTNSTNLCFNYNSSNKCYHDITGNTYITGDLY